jgi:NAD(P)-dependent dehydrogenase (short-subunit alcohol dehydrogenase family)
VIVWGWRRNRQHRERGGPRRQSGPVELLRLAKNGVDGLTRAAPDCGGQGGRINTVCPGGAQTRLLEASLQDLLVEAM